MDLLKTKTNYNLVCPNYETTKKASTYALYYRSIQPWTVECEEQGILRSIVISLVS
jgi:hypothetical protein